jgi:type VI secretion system protein ImpF
MPNVSIAPLFEKLQDEDTEIPFEKQPKRFFSPEDFKQSIRLDLERLLNTRVAHLWDRDNVNNDVTPFSYGLNATGTVASGNVFEIKALENRLDKVIRQFEPRLLNVKSKVQKIGPNPGSALVVIDAVVMVENRREELSFPVEIGL